MLRAIRVDSKVIDVYDPAAELRSIKSVDKGLQLAVDVLNPGRFEVRALVYGQDVIGDVKPAFLNYQAEWLESGEQSMAVVIDEKSLVNSILSPPYEVRNVQLLDQTRMAVLETLDGQWILK